jgi:16S rRNA G527 N7-methylase RsmG
VAGPEAARLEAYLDTVADWSPRVNLTGARTPGERVAVLVAGVVPARSLPAPGRLLDVGSGNGSPGLVLALLRDDLEVTLLEPRQKRWAFLREAARRAGREVEVLRARHDSYPGPPAATVTVRALRLPLRDLRPLVVPGGRVIVFGTTPREEPPFHREGAPPGLAASVFRAGG